METSKALISPFHALIRTPPLPEFGIVSSAAFLGKRTTGTRKKTAKKEKINLISVGEKTMSSIRK